MKKNLLLQNWCKGATKSGATLKGFLKKQSVKNKKEK